MPPHRSRGRGLDTGRYARGQLELLARDSDYPEIDPAFGNWLAGFIDGEGCFIIGQSGPSHKHMHYTCYFTLLLRADDSEILHECVKRTGLGKLNTANRPAELGYGKQQTRWKVGSRAECYRLVQILDEHPLRAKKKNDYAIWREAVLYWTSFVAPRGRRWRPTNAALWMPMARYKEQLQEGRQFKSSAVA